MAWGLPFDLDEFARRMAELNVSPDALMPALSPHLGSLVTPDGQMQQQPQQMAGMFDLPSQQGRNQDLGAVDNATTNFFQRMVRGMQNPAPLPELNSPQRPMPSGPIPGQTMAQPQQQQSPGSFLDRIGSLLSPTGMAPLPELNSPQRPMPSGPIAQPPAINTAAGTPSLGQIMTPQAAGTPLVTQPQSMAAGTPLNLNNPAATGAEQRIYAPGGKDLQGGTAFEKFMGIVRQGGVTNPNALSAIAATGSRESGWDQNNIGGSWGDRSASGQPGISGGALSWRGPRFRHLQDFASSKGLDPKDAGTQAEFFLSEDPVLIQRLQSAKSPQEAQEMMNKAWAFAGYDNPNSTESKARFAEAEKYGKMFGAGGGPGTGSGSWTAAMAKSADAPTDASGGALTGPTGNEPTATGQPTFGQRLGALGKTLNDSNKNNQDRNKPPTGTAPAPSQGSFRPDPNSIALMMQMLGAGGGGAPQMGPTLGQLLAGVGGRRGG